MNAALTTLARLAMLGAFTLSAVPCRAQAAPGSTVSPSEAVLELGASRQTFVLGEPVDLEVVARNGSNRPISISGFDVMQGFVGIVVAYEDGPFREYRGPGWGLDDAQSAPVVLGPRQRVATAASILFNHGMPSGHLNPAAAANVATRYLDEGYALPVAGRYRIKAVLYDQNGDSVVESQPLEIGVEEPTGEDREVWDALRSDPELGYFAQAGAPRGRLPELRRQQLIATIERLVTYHPGSRYTEALRERLARYQDLVDDLARRGLIAR